MCVFSEGRQSVERADEDSTEDDEQREVLGACLLFIWRLSV